MLHSGSKITDAKEATMTEQIYPWTEPEWLASAHTWIEQAVSRAGSRVIGPIEQPHVRPWSTVLRVPTSDGVYYFKAAPVPNFEPGLTLALAARDADCMPEVIAADPERGWMLTCDAGTPLRGSIHSEDDLHLLDPILPRLAEVQQHWLGQDDALLALGVFDRRVQVLPDMLENLAAQREWLLVGEEQGLSEVDYARLLGTVPHYREICTRLMAYSIGNSIHYDDMHTNNVFLRVNEFGTTRLTFSDWGDSAIGHPFCSLLIFIRQLGDAIGLPDEATDTPEGLPPVLQRVRDVYLEAWQAYAPHTDLIDMFNLAWRVGMVSRALSWQAYIAAWDPAFRPKYAYYVPAWLGEFLLTM